ncbi:12873_t:CDS:2, partial [Cetraspora pellucida]
TNRNKTEHNNTRDYAKDFVYKARLEGLTLEHNYSIIITQAILDIESHLFQNGKSILDFPDLPIADNTLIQSIRLCTTNLLIAEETNYDPCILKTYLD